MTLWHDKGHSITSRAAGAAGRASVQLPGRAQLLSFYLLISITLCLLLIELSYEAEDGCVDTNRGCVGLFSCMR